MITTHAAKVAAAQAVLDAIKSPCPSPRALEARVLRLAEQHDMTVEDARMLFLRAVHATADAMGIAGEMLEMCMTEETAAQKKAA